MSEEGRKIYCRKCNAYLGEIRDAKLRKDIIYHCTPCEDKTNNLLTLLSRQAGKSSQFGNIFDEIWGKNGKGGMFGD